MDIVVRDSTRQTVVGVCCCECLVRRTGQNVREKERSSQSFMSVCAIAYGRLVGVEDDRQAFFIRKCMSSSDDHARPIEIRMYEDVV